ncbi:MAG: hypothetical protein IIA83_03910 [Thaumarchaeota archaeon]|nr:hypothetical protein [Nitrososphaerota archaeon]
MSLEERVTEIEENSEELLKTDHGCIFCYEPEHGHKTSPTHIAGFEFVKQALKKNGVTGCNHDDLKEESIWFADFIYGSLLHEMISNHNKDQLNPTIIQQILSDYSIMEKAFDKYAIEKTKLLQDVYDYCPPEQKEYWEHKKSLIPIFCEHAKTLYEVN